MARIALDSDVVIAFLDAADDQHERAVAALRPRLTAGLEIVLGASVYAEIMVRPIARRTDAKVDEFLDAINTTVIAIDRSGARLELRGRHRSLRLPDALSLAAAITTNAELLTLDARLARIQQQEMKTNNLAPTRVLLGATSGSP